MGIKLCITSDQVSFFPFCLWDETKKKHSIVLLIEYETCSRCWIWLGDFSSYVIHVSIQRRSIPVVLCNFGCDITCQAILGDPGQFLCQEISCLALNSLPADVPWGLFVTHSFLCGGEMNAWRMNQNDVCGEARRLGLPWSHRYGQNLVFFFPKI